MSRACASAIASPALCARVAYVGSFCKGGGVCRLQILGLGSNAIPASALVVLAEGMAGVASLREFRASGQKGFLPVEDTLQRRIEAILP
eukprot:3698127-Rhodomonas_salina.1